jgi:hypothetical protein
MADANENGVLPRVDTDREISQRGAIPESAGRRGKATDQARQTADGSIRRTRTETKFERSAVSTWRDTAIAKCDGTGLLHRVGQENRRRTRPIIRDEGVTTTVPPQKPTTSSASPTGSAQASVVLASASVVRV